MLDRVLAEPTAKSPATRAGKELFGLAFHIMKGGVVNTILDVIAEAFGEKLSDHLLDSLYRARALDVFDDLIELVQKFCPSAALPEKKGLRPYVPLYRPWTTEPPRPIRGLRLRWNSSDFDKLEHPEKAVRVVDSLKHHLLYCHSLALDDPLPLLLSFVESPRARCRLLNYLGLLKRIAPLVKKEYIVLVEPAFWQNFKVFREDSWAAQTLFSGKYPAGADPYRRPPGFFTSYAEVADPYRDLSLPADFDESVAKAADFSDVPGHETSEFNAASPSVEGGSSKWDFIADGEDFIRIGAAASAFHPHRLDLYFPFRYYETICKKLFEYGLRDAKQHGQALDFRLSRLLNVQLPELEELRLEDIIAIRETNDDFENWREELSLVLERVNEPGKSEDQQRVEWTKLKGVVKQLEKDLKQSSLKEKLKPAGLTFVIGEVGTVAGPVIMGAPIFVAGAVGAGVSAFLWLVWGLGQYASSTATRRRYKAQIQHYLQFKSLWGGAA